MNRNLIVPLIVLETLACILLAFGLGAKFSPEVELFKPLADLELGLPMIVIGAVLLVLCVPMIVMWVLASMRERGR